MLPLFAWACRGPAPPSHARRILTAWSDQGALAALIPVKAFAAGKSRLRGALDDDAREDLAERLAAGVIAACDGLNPHVVCDDDGTAAWAADHGAAVIRVDRPGLNRAVRHGVATLADAGFARVLIAHADIAGPVGPRATRRPRRDRARSRPRPRRHQRARHADRLRFLVQLRRELLRPPPVRSRAVRPAHPCRHRRRAGARPRRPDDLAAYRQDHSADLPAGGQP